MGRSSLHTLYFFRNSAVCDKIEHSSRSVHSGTVRFEAEISVQNVHFWKVLLADAEFLFEVQVSLTVFFGNVLEQALALTHQLQ